uniref:EamA family transporter n=1 Tax=uncultured Thiotrichaceae bacterium TaxID=298394 RepID=A0A6S6T320_9GAMM|nr:MAG: EamA family transporter [uncultured Thiotrichaceae bacterium]
MNAATLKKDQTRGIQLMLLGCIVLPMMDASAKYMGETIAAAVIVLARFSFQSILLFPFVRKTLSWPAKAELILHIKRSISICFATVCFFTAIQVMPIADALAIFFVMPLLVTLLAPWMLGETFGWRRLIAVLVGMGGAMIIIQPGHEIFGLRAFLPLLTALGFTFYLMYTRKLARQEAGGNVAPLTMQFWSGFFGSIIMMITLLFMQPFDLPVFNLAWPELWQMRQLFMVGLLAAIGHLLVAHAFKHSDASVLAPFQYSELIVAALLGWWLFDDIPAVTTWIGAAILVASGLYIFHREQTSAAD